MRVLLHACCGPCASVAVERLLEDGHAVAMLFCNPNLNSHEEWARRLEAAQKVGVRFGVAMEVEPWDGAARMRDMEDGRLAIREPEGGARCARCFEGRLRKTWERAQAFGFEKFTTSLTTGPRKNSKLIFDIGREIGGAAFLEMDFKKRGGFQRSVELARELGLYRQDYCGCAFSKRAPL